jgi:hypothetical protein
MPAAILQLFYERTRDIYMDIGHLYYKQIIDLVNDLPKLRNNISIFNKDNSTNYEYTDNINNIRNIIINKFRKISDYDLICILILYVAYSFDKMGFEYYDVNNDMFLFIIRNNDEIEPYIPVPDYINCYQISNIEKIARMRPNKNHLKYLIKIADKNIIKALTVWWNCYPVLSYAFMIGTFIMNKSNPTSNYLMRKTLI